MIKEKIYNWEAKDIGEIELNSNIFDVKINPVLVQQVVEAHMANRRVAIAHTKIMAEVRGGGKKPWKQKGTGRARHGSSRSPLWIGGGVTFGPRKDRNFEKKINKKMKQKALFMILTDKLRNEKFKIVEDIVMDTKKTKDLVLKVKNFNLSDKKVLITLKETNENIKDSAKNLKNIKVMPADSLNVYTLLNYEYLFLTKSAVEKINKHFVKINN
ncbi:MAG: 50S ribosomal protein L4 [Patescibacteria group bacterium]|nr:50S ribosomal protein L4 [Patescibacteria group bacterium]MDD4304610.1 50S ribosomal protein L4 [Patescibacteria group bacterium]MDD4695537.1 50S ribosomal protein L4 [Patescibacteria group bacterium]